MSRQMLIEIDKARSLNTINTYFEKDASKNGHGNPSSVRKRETHLIITNRCGIVKKIGATNKVNVGGDHRIIRNKITPKKRNK